MTLIEHIKQGDAAKVTALIEQALKHKTFKSIQSQKQSVAEQTFGVELDESDGFSLAAAKATRQAYKTNKPEDHVAAMNSHIKARGSEFAPQPPKGSSFQPNVDRWHHHDKQAAMHKSEIEKANTVSEALTHRPLPRIQNGKATSAQQFYNHFRQIGMSLNDARQRLQHARHWKKTPITQDPEARKALVAEFRAIQEYIKRMSHSQGIEHTPTGASKPKPKSDKKTDQGTPKKKKQKDPYASTPDEKEG